MLGHFFCARVGERVYLRFVPFDKREPLEHELGTCLRRIECIEGTTLVMPIDLKQTAFGAWQCARQDIFAAWTRETDPANLQPKVSKLNRELAAFLRDNPPPGIEQSRLERCPDAIESPCSKRDDAVLREAFGKEYGTDAAKSSALLLAVERLGLEPFVAPPPLPPIRLEEIHLVCWMAIAPEQDAEIGTTHDA